MELIVYETKHKILYSLCILILMKLQRRLNEGMSDINETVVHKTDAPNNIKNSKKQVKKKLN